MGAQGNSFAELGGGWARCLAQRTVRGERSCWAPLLTCSVSGAQHGYHLGRKWEGMGGKRAVGIRPSGRAQHRLKHYRGLPRAGRRGVWRVSWFFFIVESLSVVGTRLGSRGEGSGVGPARQPPSPRLAICRAGCMRGHGCLQLGADGVERGLRHGRCGGCGSRMGRAAHLHGFKQGADRLVAAAKLVRQAFVALAGGACARSRGAAEGAAGGARWPATALLCRGCHFQQQPAACSGNPMQGS